MKLYKFLCIWMIWMGFCLASELNTENSLNENSHQIILKSSDLEEELSNLLVLSLDGSLNYIHFESGKKIWTHRFDSLLQYSISNSKQVEIVANPSTGELFELEINKETLKDEKWEREMKKLPFSISELVNLSPCRSSDGSLYIGSKKDIWTILDAKNGNVIKSLDSGGRLIDRQEICPHFNFNNSTIHIGYTHYNIVKYAASDLSPLWNITFIDYTSHSVLSLQNNFNQMYISSVSNGCLMAINPYTQKKLWTIDSSSPIISVFSHLNQNHFVHKTIYPISSATMQEIERITDISVVIDDVLNSENIRKIIYVGTFKATMYILEVMTSIYDNENQFLLPDRSKFDKKSKFFGYYLDYISVTPMELIEDWKRLERFINSDINKKTNDSIHQIASLFNFPIAIYEDGKIILSFGGIVVIFTFILGLFIIFSFSRRYRPKKPNPVVSGTAINLSGSSTVNAQEMLTEATVNVGCLSFYPDVILGRGCNGTIVYKGTFDGKDVAVKRVIPECTKLANREINLLKNSDLHRNVIRYHCTQTSYQFHYIALELCIGTLKDYVNKGFLMSQDAKIDAWGQIVEGMIHLHSLNIVHRDIKPQNILVKDNKESKLRFVISDFGLCKQILPHKQSFSLQSGPTGTIGWVAPEMLHPDKSKKVTKAVDIFSLGCLLYFILSNGKHPYGPPLHRMSNIANDLYKFYELDLILDCVSIHAVKSLLQQDPGLRPHIQGVKKHPLLWSCKMKLDFLMDSSDRIERNNNSKTNGDIEKDAIKVVGTDWRLKLSVSLQNDLRKFRTYQGNSVKDLLRAIRNKRHHYMHLNEQLRLSLGKIPNEFLNYFLNRFPLLLIHVYEFMKFASSESIFSIYYDENSVNCIKLLSNVDKIKQSKCDKFYESIQQKNKYI
ncbi:Endoplasmic reticulum-to-nucleus signaling 1-like protein [Intoshia linei]|uniref:non-specific serine/threonine protein kinase n=1 Tax=Intoshia linei TaxID=1819745 RepID=A0A177B4A5_9BILA|nr:Endoplasmic reticulum-to-nucleus signaling 1-like protein [Intoshia linei]